MNNLRRAQIQTLKERIEAMQAEATSIKEELETIRDCEQEYLDNMPESFASGDKGEKAQAAVDALEEVIQDLESLVENDFVSQLDTASE